MELYVSRTRNMCSCVRTSQGCGRSGHTGLRLEHHLAVEYHTYYDFICGLQSVSGVNFLVRKTLPIHLARRSHNMRMLEDGITGRIGSYCDKQKQTHERFMHHKSLNEEGDVVREIHSESNPGSD